MVWMMLSLGGWDWMPRLAPTCSKEHLHWSFSAGATVVTLNYPYSPSRGHHSHLPSHPTSIDPTPHLLCHTAFSRPPVEHVLYLGATWSRLWLPHFIKWMDARRSKNPRSPSHQDHSHQPGSKTRKVLKKSEKETQIHCCRIMFHWKGENAKTL